jgi:nicotinamidase-related amidase
MEQNTALLVMDMQAGILGSFPEGKALIPNIAQAITHARSNNMPVIYITVGFRAGAPEISPDNKGFAPYAGAAFTAEMALHFAVIDPELAPAPGEVAITKRRVSAFTGSDLEVVLRAKKIQHIVLTGVATSGVVLSTTREAADKDYTITVLSDCCADRDAEVHRVLMDKVLSRQADVLTVSQWVK